MLFFLKQAIQLKLQLNILDIDDIQNSVKRLLLSGPRAHLFYLYRSLCDMVTCEDEVVVSLVQECLLLAGEDMGL
ncbi:hypothetical protein BDB01DRAFT_511679 [Pilobolus umbonatus]|nr:hypothetical protein BDB01DRAFT_511679 [Pilobolus umbonatus]